VVSSVELDVGSLPLVTLPPSMTAAERPTPLPAADAAGLALINPNATMNPTGPISRKGPAGSSSRRLEGALGLPTSITMASSSSSQERISVNCVSAGATPATSSAAVPVRWETFSVRPDGGALWAIHDGWFDPAGCRVAEQRSVVVQPRALALLADQPVAFAVRTAEGLVVLYPALDSVLGDAMTGAVKLSRGPISRLLLPLAKGSSATVVSTHTLPRMATWLSSAEGKSAGSVALGNGTLTLRIEVTQTVSEDSPTLLLQLRSNPTR
jgi:hypothetical protein